MMKAAVISEPHGSFKCVDVSIDDPREREVLVDVRASGLCHTDKTMSGLEGVIPLPAVFGHEIAGIVAAVGPQVTDVKVGDHVVGCLLQFGGRCARCLAGQTSLCLNGASVQRSADDTSRLTFNGEAAFQVFGLGGFAERALVHESQLIVVPDTIPFPQAALLGCGGVTGIGAVLNVARVDVGETVVVIGVGGVGLNAVSGARLAGASSIIAVDIDPAALDRARRFGATHTINSREGSPADALRRILPGGANAVFDFVGTPTVTREGHSMTTRGGGLYIIGSVDPFAEFSMSYASMIVGQTRVQGIDMGGTTTRRDIPRYADLYLQGRLELDELVSLEIGLDEIDDGYASLSRGDVARVVVTRF